MEIILAPFGILGIILFFKIWGACNDIKRLADKYAPEPGKDPHKFNRPPLPIETKGELKK